ncbi:DUF4362 domain-containing protein [Sporosarcina soli]|uniref:DUF4362 domain-containing protein n=1 Tax=Sporosarcina soli TaxID=334736 RepID=A0ABW0TDF3_9BACL
MQKCLYLFGILIVLLLSACSYDSDKAVKNGDVINMHGPIYNFPRFEHFLESTESGEKASVRITNYTPEGNPTLYNLSFNGTVFDLEIDRTKNKDRGDNPAKTNMTCTGLLTEEGEQLFIYTLEGCQQPASTENFMLLSISKEQLEEHDHSH